MSEHGVVRWVRVSGGRALALTAVTFLALLAVGLLRVDPAYASITHPLLSSFDGSATPAGSFGGSSPSGVAVDNSSGPAAGKVYVIDSRHAVVDRFSGTGAYDCQITGRGSTSATTPSGSECDPTTTGTPSGRFENGMYATPAVDPATGDLYVPDPAGHAVDRFDASGGYLGQFVLPDNGTPNAVALDPTGDLLVVDKGNAVVRRYDVATSSWSVFASGTPTAPAGVPSGPFGFQLSGVAVDIDPTSPSYGNVYVADSYPSKVVAVFDATGTFLRRLTGTPKSGFGNNLSIAVDPGSGDLYVGEGGNRSLLDQFGPTGGFKGQVEVPGAQPAFPIAVAINAVTGNVYVADRINGVVDVFGPGVVVPDVVTSAVTNVGATSATPTGTVDPDGVTITDCHFDWGTTAGYGHTATCVETVGSGGSPVTVHAALSGLQPDTTYHVRLQATNANGTVVGDDTSFSTPPPPTIANARASKITGSSAELHATVNPEGYATSYHIEWGTSTSYGATVPVPDATVGSGTRDVPVVQSLSGLSPNTTYHWRVVATSIVGTTTSVNHTFVYGTDAAGTLPDNRAYEQVTPVQKNGAQFDVGAFIPQPKVSGNGERVIATSIQCLPGATSCTANRQSEGSVFALDRSPGGWVTTQLSPAATVFNANSPVPFDANSGTALFTANLKPGDGDQWVSQGVGGSLRVIGPLGSSSATPAPIGPGGYTVTSADMSRIAFAYVPGRLGWPFDTTASGVNSLSLYEYVGSGNAQPVLVGVSGGSGSTALISECGTKFDGPGAMSQDGRTIFFMALSQTIPGCPATATAPTVNELYARIDESRTVPLSQRSASTCTTSACQSSPPADAAFAAASDDGSKALFTSTQQLTDDAAQGSTNLYLYDFSRPSGDELIDVSAGDSSGNGPGVKGVTAQSADGSHVYFVATGVLTQDRNDQGQTATVGANNLYVYEQDAAHPDGRLSFVASVPDSDANYLFAGLNSARANVTPDGRFLAFPSHGPLTANVTSGSGAAQVFRYDAQADRLIRISIGEGGYNDNGNAGDPSLCAGQPRNCTADASLAAPRVARPRRDPTMSHDGAYVFFQSPAALTPQALNYVPNDTSTGASPVFVQNVYEYHDGHVFLISDGKDTFARQGLTTLVGTDATGANVFFKSFSSLVPQDTDGGQLDIYDARVCTDADPCITPPAPPLVCERDLCQGTPSPSSLPTLAFPGTATFTAPVGAARGTSSTPRSPSKDLRVSKIKTVHGTSTKVKVKVPGKGKLRTSGSGLRRSYRTAKKAGRTYRVSVRLSKRARRTLRRKHRVKVRVTVRFTPAEGKRQRVRVHAKFRPKKHRHHQKSSSRSTRRATVLSSDVRKGR